MGKGIRTGRGFWLVLMIPVPICLMVWKITNNMSSAIIIFGIALLMLFVASPDYKRFVLMGAAGVAAVAALVFAIIQMEHSDLGFRGGRILAWLNPEAYASGTGFQTLQALYAIGSGGIFGKGLGQSMQKLGFLPEAQNDMIFSIICEELGLFGGIAVIFAFCAAHLAFHGNCQQCLGSVRRAFGGWSDGAYCHSGDPEHRRSNQYHSKHRYFPAVYQLRWLLGHVPAH